MSAATYLDNVFGSGFEKYGFQLPPLLHQSVISTILHILFRGVL